MIQFLKRTNYLSDTCKVSVFFVPPASAAAPDFFFFFYSLRKNTGKFQLEVFNNVGHCLQEVSRRSTLACFSRFSGPKPDLLVPFASQIDLG